MASSNARAKNIAGYRAPDQVIELPKATHKSDVYSFGVLLLELLTGKLPTEAALNDELGILDLPRWVRSIVAEERLTEVFDLELQNDIVDGEMSNLLQTARRCVDLVPKERPTMSDVQLLLEDVHPISVNNSQKISSRQSVSPLEGSPFRASESGETISSSFALEPPVHPLG